LKIFENIYSSYCDCGKFIDAVDYPSSDAFAYLISRGAELLDNEDHTVATKPNTCTLHKLIFPTVNSDWELEEVKRYEHPE
jgi:hypothetical protein